MAFGQVKGQVLRKFFEHANVSQAKESLDEDELVSICHDIAGTGIILAAVTELESEGYLIHTSLAPARCRITPSGIKAHEEANAARSDTSIEHPGKVTSAEPRSGRVPRFRKLREDLLVALYRRAEQEGFDTVFDLKDVADKAGLAYRSGEIDLCATYLDDHALVRAAFSMGPTDMGKSAAISTDGIEEAEYLISELDEEEYLHRDEFDRTSDRVSSTSPPNLSGQTEESSQDVWEPLPINRTQPAYEEAVSAFESAVGVIEGDNGYAVTEPDERNQIVWSIKEGLRALKELTPSRAQIRSMIVGPLQYVSKKFVDTAMGIAARDALLKLGEWLAGLG